MPQLSATLALGCLVVAVLLMASAAACLLEELNRPAFWLLAGGLVLLVLSRLGHGKAGR